MYITILSNFCYCQSEIENFSNKAKNYYNCIETNQIQTPKNFILQVIIFILICLGYQNNVSLFILWRSITFLCFKSQLYFEFWLWFQNQEKYYNLEGSIYLKNYNQIFYSILISFNLFIGSINYEQSYSLNHYKKYMPYDCFLKLIFKKLNFFYIQKIYPNLSASTI